jgi:molybdenum-dependent DNA-binding transcriptional regulator ModE
MAKGQRQGVGSLTVPLIVFVALFCVSTVVSVIMYTGQEDIRNNNDRLTEANKRLISSSERSSLTLFQDARAGGPTVVGLLEGARAQTALLATGDDSDDAAAVAVKLNDLLRVIQSEGAVEDGNRFADISYHEALTMLFEAHSAEHALRATAEERVAQLEAEVEQLALANIQEKSGFEKRAKEIGDQLADVEAGRTHYRTERDAQVAQIEKNSKEQRLLSDADLTEERQRSSRLETEVALSQERTQALQERFADLMIGPEQLATARRADGHILMAHPGDNVVYINRGKGDRLVLGLRFAVYAAGDGIPADGRAKAQIKVVTIDKNSAECEIVTLAANQVILKDDLIANPIYERDRAVGFLVAGEFDLDHDGRPDRDGASTIEALISDWGGTISPELTSWTEFVVLGRAPRRPRAITDTTSGPMAERARQMQQAYDKYQATLSSAESMSVPVLTQEVFLNFLGYARG